jgi:hypothetical protein
VQQDRVAGTDRTSSASPSGTDLAGPVAALTTGTGATERRARTGRPALVRLAHQEPSLGRFLVRFGITDESMRAIVAGPPMRDLEVGIRTGRYDVDASQEPGITSLLMGTTVSAMWMVIEGHQAWREAGSEAARLVLRALGVAAEEAAAIASEPLPAGA